MNDKENFVSSICGQSQNGGSNEDIYDVDVTFEHTGASVTVEILSTLVGSAGQRSWGIRDFQLYSIALQTVHDEGVNDESIFYKAFQGNTFVGLDGWNIVLPYDENGITSCGGTRLLGGFGVIGKGSSLVKQIDLPPHSGVDIRF